MKQILSWFGAVAVLAGVSSMASSRKTGMADVADRVEKEVRKRAHMIDFVEHVHDAVTHEHDHYHITHHKREGMYEVLGEWEHLTSSHGHLHNHPAIAHAHGPHEDAEHEHLSEAHIHDHEHPTRS